MSARRLVLAVFVAVAGVSAFVGSSALASPPETPSAVTVESVDASAATFLGIVNPGKEGPPGTYELGTYEFLYKKNSSSCEGEGKAPESLGRADESPGISLGGGKEALPPQRVTGLEANTKYTVCLLVRNGSKGEASVGPSISFTTSTPPEASEDLKAEPIGATTATLTGVLDPNHSGEAGSYEFAYRRSSSECQRQNPVTRLAENESATPNQFSTGDEGEVVKAEVNGLLPNVPYTFCLITYNKAGETSVSAPKTFVTLTEAPSVSGESILHLGSTSASVTAQVNPGGLETTYSVKYGMSTAYGSESSSTTVAAASSAASASLSGLQPNTEYHFRFVVTNKDGTVMGRDVAFTTYAPEVPGLPDGRVYELVSQFGNQFSEVYLPNGEEYVPGAPGLDGSIYSNQPTPFESSVDGNAAVFAGSGGSTGGSGGTAGAPVEYHASRLPQGGWTLENFTPNGDLLARYQGFTRDLSVGFATVPAEPPLVVSQAPHEPVRVVGLEYVHGLYMHALDEADFRPYFIGTPRRHGHRHGSFQEYYAGSSPDSNYQLVESNEDLLEGEGGLEKELLSDIQKEAEGVDEIYQLEEEIEGLNTEAKRLLGEGKQSEAEIKQAEAKLKEEENNTKEAIDNPVDNNKELYAVTNGRSALVNVSPDGHVDQNATFGAPGGSLEHVISADGSRIYWTGATGLVYVREDGAMTVQVSQGPARFWTASADGTYAFYTEAGKLWRYDVANKTDVELAGSEAGVQSVVGTNETGEDGAYVYFVAQEKLTTEENAAKQQAVEGENNLYVAEPDGEHPGQSKITFISAGISLSDLTPGQYGLVNLTPDGHGLVFASANNLTGKPYPAEGSEEVYVYDTQDASLVCTSCRPQASGGNLVPSLNRTYTSRWISEDGDQVFFSSTAPLVAQDVNGKQDVYEWERDGSGACSEASGCVYLISNGVEGAASFIEASASGNDVFIATRERLVPELGNENEELYDARVGGVRPVIPPQCTGTGCQGVPAPAPIFATPASVTFEGVGNFPPTAALTTGTKVRSLTRAQKLSRTLKACRKKHDIRKRSACEAQARKSYGAKTKAKKSAKRKIK